MKPKRRSAIVMTGGRSLRMGADKAKLPWRGITMLEWIVAELAHAFEDLVVVAGLNQDMAGLALPGIARVICDTEPFQGPVRALRVGLTAVQAEVAFTCGCDLPFLNPGLAAALCDMTAGHDAAIPMVGGRLQVLHAAYRKSCLPALDAMLQRGERALHKVASALNSRIINEDELRRYDPELLSFFNVNTPEDYGRARRLGGKQRS